MKHTVYKTLLSKNLSFPERSYKIKRSLIIEYHVCHIKAKIVEKLERIHILYF